MKNTQSPSGVSQLANADLGDPFFILPSINGRKNDDKSTSPY